MRRSAGLRDDEQMHRARTATLASSGLTLVLVGLAAGLGAAAARRADLPALGLTTLAVLTTGAVGALIGLKLPGHRIGTVLTSTALLYSTVLLAESYARYVILDGHHGLSGGEWAALWVNASWPLMFGGVIAVALLFPDGRLLSPRWRWAACGTALCVVGIVALGLFTAEPFDAPFGEVDPPLPALPAALAPLHLVLLAGLLACVVASVVSARRRYLRAAQIERQQLLWLAASAWLIPVTLVVCFADAVVDARLDALVLGMLLMTVTALPMSIAVAVLRYRLYDLDRVVNRTLVYGALTGLVLAAYYAVVVIVGGLLRTEVSFALTLVTTATVVIVADPLRRRLQRGVDRLMYGDRADPYTGLSRLAARLEDSVTPQMALRTIVDTVADSLKVPFVSVDLVQADPDQSRGLRRAASHGDTEPEERLLVPLTFQGDAVGRLVVGQRPGEQLSSADHRLLTELARHAGAVVHATRLTIELQASRERLVEAQEDVRRRLRRDLHDGLGPTLAGAVFQVDIARDALPVDAIEASEQLDALRRQLKKAVEDIRGMSYALRPPALDNGLVAAITEQISSTSTNRTPHVTLSAPPSLPPLPAAVETAAYRIAMEAVANATRHSDARTCAIRLDLNGGLEVEILDDGRGTDGRPFQAGVGITSMRERAAELGAALTIERLAAGTRVHTVLPVGGE